MLHSILVGVSFVTYFIIPDAILCPRLMQLPLHFIPLPLKALKTFKKLINKKKKKKIPPGRLNTTPTVLVDVFLKNI